MCSSLKTIKIPGSVTTIGMSAFHSCENLICIYFYGETSPTIVTNAFSGVPVMTLEIYKDETFGDLNVFKGTTLDECLPATHTFTESNTFTVSLVSGEVLSNTLTLMYSLTLTQTVSVYNSTHSKIFSASFIESSLTYIETEVVSYHLTVIVFSSGYSYYLNILTIYYPSNTASYNTKTIIIAVYVSIASTIIIIIALLVVLLIKIHIKKNDNKTEESEDFEYKNFETKETFALNFLNSKFFFDFTVYYIIYEALIIQIRKLNFYFI